MSTLAQPPQAPPLEDGSRLLDTAGAAAHLGISLRQTKKLIARGDLPSLLIGRSRRVPLDALRHYVSERLEAGDGR